MPGIEQTYNRILAYLKGMLSDRQRHDLEKDLMHDVFEDEAFEGLSQLSAGELEADMNVLMNRLDNRVYREKRRNLKMYFRLAAGILLLAGIGSIFYFVLRKPPENLLTEEINREKSTVNTVPEPPAVTREPVYSDTVKINKSEEKKKPLISQAKHPVLAENRTESREQPISPTTSRAESKPIAEELVSDEINVVRYGIQKEPEPKMAVSGEKSADLLNAAPKSDQSQQGKAAGVEASQKSTRKADIFEVKEETESYPIIKPIPPGGSLKDFRKWVDGKLDYAALKSYPGKQRILVNLTIHADGTINYVQIRDSVPPAIAAELIKVIAQSPLWKPALRNNVPVETEVVIRFVITVE